MKLSKRIQGYIAKIIVIAFILAFPFGQLLRFEFYLSGKLIPILILDIIAGFSVFLFPFVKKPEINNYFYAFFLTSLFSLILSFNIFSLSQVLIGSLYLIRFFSYFSFMVIVWGLANKNEIVKNNFMILFMITLTLSAIFGWLQYFLFPDLTYLKYAGWDDHLGRIVGTFLDPGFTGMVFVIGFFIVFLKYINDNRKIYFILSLLFLLSILFTYSRASYAAFLSGSAVIYLLQNKIKPILFFLIVFVISIPLLPRTEGEGVKLERTKSVNLRFENYKQSVKIIKSSPLFGIGFNNICWLRSEIFSDSSISHSCSGSDSSLLFILATSGIVGFLIFLNILIRIFKTSISYYYGTLTRTVLSALIFHSIFNNSLFYPWTMGALFFITAFSIPKKQF